MKPLAELFISLGCENVRTYIQSGNVVFQTDHDSMPDLAKRLSDKVLQDYGFEPKVLLLDATELASAITNSPFPTEDGKLLHFFFLETNPEAPALEKLDAVKQQSEKYQLNENVFYLYAPDGVSRSKLFAKIEKCLDVPATARNWNTVNKLSSMVDG